MTTFFSLGELCRERERGEKKEELSLIGEFVNMQGDRTSFISLLVFLRCVQISLRVACIIGRPQRHWSSCNGNLHNKQRRFYSRC